MVLYGRRISVSVAGLVITEPRIRAVVERQADSTETTGYVDIYNLAPARERQIYRRSARIVIEAGYPDTVATIFEGQVQRVRHPRQNLARITHIELGDQARSLFNLGGVTSRSYFGVIPIIFIIPDFVKDLGLSLGPLSFFLDEVRVKDFAWAGPSGEGLTVLLRKANARWFEDDGVCRFARLRPQADATTVTISPRNGLVGSPLLTDEGAECVMFLNPLIKIGGILDLSSDALSGRYRIVGVRHDADNWADPFITWVDLRETQF